MTNALAAQGYRVTEPMIAGGGAALAFAFQEGTFPWLSARNGEMRELFFQGAGIAWERRLPADRHAGWAEISSLLAAGTPVVLRVDMRYLPYRYGGRYGPAYTSFGWHLITLFAVNDAEGYALVSDTEYRTLQRISLRDLEKARTSRTRKFPPRGEYYWAEKAPSGYKTDWSRLLRSSIVQVIANYETDAAPGADLAGLEGMARYGERLAALESYVRPAFLLPQALEYMAGNIEDFGTGGAAFRILYRDFLVQAAEETSGPDLSPSITAIERCIAAWRGLSAEFRAAAAAHKGAGKGERTARYARLRAAAEALYAEESAFYRELKRVYTAP